MKLFSSLTVIIIITLPFCISDDDYCETKNTVQPPEGPSVHCINASVGHTESHIYYECLSKNPTFDLRDLAIEQSKKFDPCNFHTKVACTSGNKPDDKRLCNSDLILIEGSPELSEKILHGAGSSVKGQWILIIMAVAILGMSQFSDELTCCVNETELVIREKTDDDQFEGSPCTNRGTSCKDVSCGTNTCSEDYYVPDTTCTAGEMVQCQGARPACRLLYYEVAEDKSPEDEELDLELTYYARQDCYDNSNGEVEMGCTFYKKTFYLTNKRRETYQKECFCNNADICNKDLFEICVATDDEIKIVNDTCSHLTSVGVRKAISVKTVIMYYIAYLMTYL